MNKSYFHIHPKLTEIRWPAEISREILEEQLAWKASLENMLGDKIEEIRLGFHTLSIAWIYQMSHAEFDGVFQLISESSQTQRATRPKCWKIPVCYDPSLGIDLSFVAKKNQLSPQKVIQLHTSTTYLLHFYGFLPGFMYLGGLDPQLFTSRKSTPDKSIKAGAVAIGGKQTGIYPCQSPGGWHVIGNSPIPFFDIKNEIPVIPTIGDEIRFEPISLEEYQMLGEDIRQYQWKHE